MKSGFAAGFFYSLSKKLTATMSQILKYLKKNLNFLLPTPTKPTISVPANFATMRKVVTLQFTSIAALWLFKGEVHPNYFEVNVRLRIITCACSEKELNLAVNSFHATIIPGLNKKEEKEIRNNVA